MNSELLVALMALIGTCFGSLAGILAANRLVNYRLERLEEKVNKHNQVIERTCRLEFRMDTLEQARRKEEA